MSDVRYALVTPARNEADYVEKTIASVVAQTVLPARYIIVSDGSTDATDAIVQSWADRYDFIELVRSGDVGVASFGSKARAVAAGRERLAGLDYEYFGVLDADVSFESDYFKRLFAAFGGDPDLGLAGGIIRELVDGEFVAQTISENSVAGAVQMFRRECYEAIGGYPAIARGGIDSVAEITARMQGWKVRTLFDLPVLHHRRVFTGTDHPLGARFNKGVINYQLGYHPLFHLAVCARRVFQRPVLLGALSGLWGYARAAATGKERSVSDEFIRYLRAEQMARLGLGKPPRPVGEARSRKARSDQ